MAIVRRFKRPNEVAGVRELYRVVCLICSETAVPLHSLAIDDAAISLNEINEGNIHDLCHRHSFYAPSEQRPKMCWGKITSSYLSLPLPQSSGQHYDHRQSEGVHALLVYPKSVQAVCDGEMLSEPITASILRHAKTLEQFVDCCEQLRLANKVERPNTPSQLSSIVTDASQVKRSAHIFLNARDREIGGVIVFTINYAENVPSAKANNLDFQFRVFATGHRLIDGPKRSTITTPITSNGRLMKVNDSFVFSFLDVEKWNSTRKDKHLVGRFVIDIMSVNIDHRLIPQSCGPRLWKIKKGYLSGDKLATLTLDIFAVRLAGDTETKYMYQVIKNPSEGLPPKAIVGYLPASQLLPMQTPSLVSKTKIHITMQAGKYENLYRYSHYIPTYEDLAWDKRRLFWDRFSCCCKASSTVTGKVGDVAEAVSNVPELTTQAISKGTQVGCKILSGLCSCFGSCAAASKGIRDRDDAYEGPVNTNTFEVDNDGLARAWDAKSFKDPLPNVLLPDIHSYRDVFPPEEPLATTSEDDNQYMKNIQDWIINH